jgi:hypothetical protein
MKRFEKTPKSSERLSYVYRTEFTDGSIHFGRVNASKNYSPKNYIGNAVSAVKHNANNPLRASMTTEFEYKVANELKSVKCEIVFAGPTDEAKKFRNEQVAKVGIMCMNARKAGSDSLGIDNIVTIAKEYSKALKSANEILYFIDPRYGRSIGLADKMISNVKHPLYPNFIKLACIQVERV